MTASTTSATAVSADLVSPPGLTRHAFAAMGTNVAVLVPSDRASEAAGVERLMLTWDSVCTRFDPDSELSRLNAAGGRPRIVSELLFEVLRTAQQAAWATNGLFDPTLLRSLEAIGYDRDFAALVEAPARRRAPAALPVTGGWRRLELDPATRTARLPNGVGLDLGGLAKGMAVDAAIAGLRARDVTMAAVDAGGDLAVLALPPDATAWPIAIDGPNGDRIVSLTSGGLATSSVARRHWRQGDVARHHLIDPRSGLPSTSPLWSVSVAAASCGQAEVAAKAAFLLGPDEGSSFLAGHGLAGLFLLPDGGERWAGRWSPS
ncbi:MAG: FAD:protein FMN transferase [Candidatus Limnocylindrales bacterium]